MKNVLLAVLFVPLLTLPAFAGASNAGDKPMVVAEGVEVGVGGVGVGVGIGGGHRHRNHVVVVEGGHHHYHHHHGVIIR